MKKYLSIVVLILCITTSTHIISMETNQEVDPDTLIQQIKCNCHKDATVLLAIKYLTGHWWYNGAVEDMTWTFEICSMYLKRIFEALAKKKLHLNIPSNYYKKASEMIMHVINENSERCKTLERQQEELIDKLHKLSEKKQKSTKAVKDYNAALEVIKKYQSGSNSTIPKAPVFDTSKSTDSTTSEKISFR